MRVEYNKAGFEARETKDKTQESRHKNKDAG
jgi:hypothetical protein